MTGERIKEYRKKHRYSQRELAEALGVAQTAVSGWETGERRIRLEVLERIAEVLNEPITVFLEEPFAEQVQADIKGTIKRDRNGNVMVKDFFGRRVDLDEALVFEADDVIAKAVQEADITLLKGIEKVPDVVLLQGIVDAFNSIDRRSKVALYQHAVELKMLEYAYTKMYEEAMDAAKESNP